MVIKERRKRKDIWKVESRKWFLFYFLLSTFIFACSSPQPTAQNQIVTISYSPYTEFQMDEVYACANDLSIILKISENPEIKFQLGEPDVLLDFAYQIGDEEIIVVSNKQSQLQSLSLDEVRNLFASGENVWVYSSDSEMQMALNQVVMQGRSVSVSAQIAVSSRQAVEKIESQSDAIGFIPKSLITENLKEIYSIGILPVLALTETEPQGAVQSLLACLQ